MYRVRVGWTVVLRRHGRAGSTSDPCLQSEHSCACSFVSAGCSIVDRSLKMIPHKPHHKGFKRPDPNKSWGRKTPQGETQGDVQESIPQRRGLNPRGSSNRAKRRASWQAKMVRTYAHETRCVWRDCSDPLGLAHAHRLKKRLILTEEEWVHGQVKLCLRHHLHVEHGDRKHKGTHRRMYRLVTLLMRKQSRPSHLL